MPCFIKKHLVAAYHELGCPMEQLSMPQDITLFETVRFLLIDPDKEDIKRTTVQDFTPTMPDQSTIAGLDGLSQ